MHEVGESCRGCLTAALMRGGGEDAVVVRVGWTGPVKPGRAVAVWVDGDLTSWTDYVEDRGVWVLLDRGVSHRIDVREVSREALVEGFATAPKNHGVSMTRDAELPIDAWVTVSGNRARLNRRVWPGGGARGGFGARFGTSAFGLGGEGSPGLGLGALGDSDLGLDGVPIWLSGSVLRQLGDSVRIAVATAEGLVSPASDVSLAALSEGPSYRGITWVEGVLRLEPRNEVAS
ncbi:hypothetical protein [Mucisphaera sp.]|uniref:hypothetical protein n=1 Tax=Mucisphaera sp. TaxID=2913024 RepID=UPI003D0CF552